jgi:hypothetical protein
MMFLEDSGAPSAPWWTQLATQGLTMLVAIGAGFRWVLTWAFARMEKQQADYLMEMREERAAHREEIDALYVNLEKLAEILRQNGRKEKS